jgi:hypothetical protein
VLTERHPEIQVLQRDLERISQEPTALVAARQDERRLRADYAARGGREEQLVEPEAVAITNEPAVNVEANVAAAGELAPVRRVNGPTVFARRAHATIGDVEFEQRRDDAFAVLASGATDETTERLALEDLMAEAAPADDDLANYGRALLKNALDSYQDLRTRLANVQIELETAQAAFNYRYSVTVPARVPRDPDSPNVPFVVLGGLIAGLVAGMALAVFAELRARSLLSPQALGRHLGFVQEPATE